MKDSNRKGTSFGTILTIGLIGAALGVMFIPYRRNEIRNKVVSGAQDAADFITEKLKYTADEIVSRTEKLLDKTKSNVDHMADEAKEVKDKWDKSKHSNTEQDFKL